ncbi:hypothetical protein SAMN04490243_1045 [Robiginitalea myxolifaciens]|uniref:Uncharacterized protein n=1 Tax=Robiginitalea myxolifaciens TaxID=400055 RepID=A0A1I6G150_9FLAO|nr:hypothetical protein [Robiginitalea myxolifaciens]SFR35787.1 hypothetical protein SAMN04490243_1045 [Robiginitalea myxolifaciens]
MPPKLEAEKLLKENAAYSDPMNFALHLCSELIREYTKISPEPNKAQYWEEVKKELLKIKNSR